MTMTRASRLAVMLMCLAGFLVGSAAAQTTYPTKPIRIIVPFAAGGSIDIVPRMLAERLPAILGQPIVVENRAGAGGNLGAEAVFTADPDGHTLLASPMPLLTINQHLYKDMRFDPLRFAPVTVLTRYPSVMLARSTLPANTIEELVGYAKKNPDKLTYASQGVGTIGHVAFERFRDTVKINAVHVPYKGNGPALNDLIAGHVDLLVSDLIAAMPGLESRRIKLLAVGGDKRISAFPKVQTISESIPDFFLNSWIGLVSTPKTPDAVTAKLAEAIAKALADPAVSKRLAQLFAEPAGEGPQAMQSVMQRDSKMWADVIRHAKIVLQ